MLSSQERQPPSVATRRIGIGILSDVIRKKPTPLPTAKPNDRHFTYEVTGVFTLKIQSGVKQNYSNLLKSFQHLIYPASSCIVSLLVE